MNCTNLTEDGQECGDEGVLCDACFEQDIRDHLWMRGLSYGAITGRMSAEDEQDVRDAGRSHLLP